jgi:GNAT superfamily N-acetyltransferase
MSRIAPPWLAQALPEWVHDYLSPPPDARARFFAAAIERAAKTGTALEAKGAVLGIEPLPWDSEHFGLPCARLAPLCIDPALAPFERHDIVSGLVDRAMIWCRTHRIAFALRRMVAARADEAPAFEERGFRLADLILTFTAAPQPHAADGVRLARESDLSALRRIAGAAFPYSRFVADARFEPAKTGEIYTRWLDTLVTGVGAGEKSGAGATVFVADERDAITGFIALRSDAELDATAGRRVALIELFAVAPPFRGQGYGSRLLAVAKDWAWRRDAALVEASTWAPAVAATRSYAKAGFEMRDSLLTFHCHLDRAIP